MKYEMITQGQDWFQVGRCRSCAYPIKYKITEDYPFYRSFCKMHGGRQYVDMTRRTERKNAG